MGADALAAQQPLLQYDMQLAALRARRLQAVVDLDHALGGGLALPTPPTDHDDNIARAPMPGPARHDQ